MGGVAPGVDEIVGFLDRFSPGALQSLRRAHPRQADLLEPGQLAGDQPTDADLRVEVALVGLKEALDVSAKTVPALRARLGHAQAWLFAGQLLTMIGGASILPTLALDAGKFVTYLAGAIALLGSCATLGGQHLDGTLHPAVGKLVDVYRELSDHRVEASQIRNALSVAVTAGNTSGALELVPTANQLCLQIGKLMARII